MTPLVVEERGELRIVRVGDRALTYPTLAAFFDEIRLIVDGGARGLVVDLRAVAFVDSPAIGCLMDIHRLLGSRVGALRLFGLRPHVETMVRLTGVHIVVGLHADEAEALAAFDR